MATPEGVAMDPYRTMCAASEWPGSAVGGRRRDRLDQVAKLVLRQIPGHVGLADDADQIMAVDDREAADTILLHGAECLLDRVVRADGDRLTFSKLRHLGRGRVFSVRDALHDDV